MIFRIIIILVIIGASLGFAHIKGLINLDFTQDSSTAVVDQGQTKGVFQKLALFYIKQLESLEKGQELKVRLPNGIDSENSIAYVIEDYKSGEYAVYDANIKSETCNWLNNTKGVFNCWEYKGGIYDTLVSFDADISDIDKLEGKMLIFKYVKDTDLISLPSIGNESHDDIYKEIEALKESEVY